MPHCPTCGKGTSGRWIVDHTDYAWTEQCQACIVHDNDEAYRAWKVTGIWIVIAVIIGVAAKFLAIHIVW